MEQKINDLLQRIRKGKSLSSLSNKNLTSVIAELDGWSIEPTMFLEDARHYGRAGHDGLPELNGRKLGVNSSVWTISNDFIDGEHVNLEPDLDGLKSYHADVSALPKFEDAKKPKANSLWFTAGEIEINNNRGSFEINAMIYTKGIIIKAPNGEKIVTDMRLYRLDRFAKDNGMMELINEALGLPTLEIEKYEAKQAKLRDQSNMGTCGCCGGVFKLKADGTLVNHGYERPGNGYTIGKCQGQGHLPYELSINGSVAGRDYYGAQLASVITDLNAMNNGEVVSLPVHVKDNDGSIKTIMIEVGRKGWDTTFAAELRNLESANKQLEDNINWLDKKINEWVLIPTLDEQREARKAESV